MHISDVQCQYVEPAKHAVMKNSRKAFNNNHVRMYDYFVANVSKFLWPISGQMFEVAQYEMHPLTKTVRNVADSS